MKKRFQKIYIEISNICNLQCTFCPEVERDKKIMGVELFNKILGEANPLCEEITLHLMGEPLAHPQFAEIVNSCQAAGVKINLTTNGILLQRYPQELFLQSCFKQINFSLHSFHDNFKQDNQYQKKIEPYLKSIADFSARALEQNPDLYINYRLWNLAAISKSTSSKSDIPFNSNTSNKLIMDYISQYFQVPFQGGDGNVDVAWKKSKKIKGRIYWHFNSQFQWPKITDVVRSTRGFCHGITSHLAIQADGTVVPCCLDKEANIPLGNCSRDSLQDIVNGSRAENMHRGFLKRQLVEDLCQRCTFISRFDNKV